MKKQFIGNCINHPFGTVEELSSIIDNAREITKQTLLRNCDIDEITQEQMKEFPNDYMYYKNRNIYFYEWSMIEFFYK